MSYQMHQWICSPILWVVFLLYWWSPLLCKTFLVWHSPICLFFSFVSFAWGDIFDKIFKWKMSKILLPMLSLRIFVVSGLTTKSLIHFEFILVCGGRRWSSFLFLHIPVQFFQHNLLYKLSLAHHMYLLSLSNINWP